MFVLVLFVQELANQMLDFPVPRPKQTQAGTVQKGQYETILSPVESIGVLLARLAISSASGVRMKSGASSQFLAPK